MSLFHWGRTYARLAGVAASTAACCMTRRLHVRWTRDGVLGLSVRTIGKSEAVEVRPPGLLRDDGMAPSVGRGSL